MSDSDTMTDDILAAWRRPIFDLAGDTVLIPAGEGEIIGYSDVLNGREAFEYSTGLARPRGRPLAVAWDRATGAEGERIPRSPRAPRGPDVPGASGAGRLRPDRSSRLMRLEMARPPPT
jgi:hypothetical protein